MPLTAQDARALTYLARRLRDDTHGAREWDEAGTYAVVSRLIGQHLATSIERVMRHAGDPEARTPAAIERPFLPDPATPGPRIPARPADECRTHPGEYADACRGCAADRLAGTPTARPTSTTTDHAAGIARVRAALATTPEETP